MMTNILIWTLMALFIFWFFGGFKYISKVKKRKRVRARLKDQSIGTQLKQLTDALENTNLSQIHGLLSQANYHQLSLMEPLCAKYVSQLTEYVKQYPDQENGLYLLGVAETDIAWQLRSGAVSNKLSDKQVNDFMQYLGRAETTFSKVMELKPDQPHLYPMMLRVMKGLGKKQEAYRLYAQANDQKALSYKAAREMVSLLSERWLGDVGEMLTFAREQLSMHGNLPGMFAIVLDAYIERDIETDEKKFFKKPELSQAVLKAEAEIAGYDKTDYLDQNMHYAALNTLALIHIERGERKKAKALFEVILNHYDPHPWKYRHSDPKALFMEYATRFA